jgi:DHA1 family multidrug resistance protein B-like MFS transporter
MLLASTLTGTVEMQLTNYIGVHLSLGMLSQDVHLGHFVARLTGINMVGFLQTENTLLVVLFASMAMAVAQRLSDGAVLALGIGMNAAGYAVLCFATSPWMLGAAMLVATLGEVLRVPVTQAYMGDLAPAHSRSSYLAVMAMSFGVSRVLASFGIVLGAHVSPWTMSVVTLGLGFAGYLGYTRVMTVAHARRRAERNAMQTETTC